MILMMMEVTTTTAMMMMMMMCRIKDDEYDGGDGDNDVEDDDDDDDGDGYDSYDLLRLLPWRSTLHGHVGGGCDGYLSGRKKMMPAVAPCPRLDSLN